VNSKLKGEPVSDTIYLNAAEIDALYEGYKKIRRKAFDDQVMRTVLAPDEKLSQESLKSIYGGTMITPYSVWGEHQAKLEQEKAMGIL
jgi:hypothetical protein